MSSAASGNIQMPQQIARQRELEDRWNRVRSAFEESVRQIQERASPAEQPALLARAVGQFRRHVDALQEDLPQLEPVVDELDTETKGETLQAKVHRLVATLKKLRASGKALVCHVEGEEGVRKGGPVNAYQELCEKAKELRQRDATLDEPSSIAKAAVEFPQVYERYRQERRAGVSHLPPRTSVTKAAPATKPRSLQQIEAKAWEKVHRGEATDIHEGIAKVAEEDRGLYAQYQAERAALLGGRP